MHLVIMDSESNLINLENSSAFIDDTMKRTKVVENNILIKYEVLGEGGANERDEFFDLDASSVPLKFKRSNNTTLLSEVPDEECEFNNQRNHLEFADNCNIVSKIHLSVPTKADLVDMNAKEILKCHRNYKKKKTEEKVCRFCFKMCCNFKTIDDNIIDISDVLLPGIDLSAVREPVMCTHCEEVLSVSFEFKERCLYTHNYLIQFVSKKNDGVKLNLKEIYMTKHKNNISSLEDQNICGLCMCPVKNCSAIYLDAGERDGMLRTTLAQRLPELDLSIIDEPVICAPCHVSLENHSRFLKNVLIGEQKITIYKEYLDVNSKSQIDLSSLLQFTVSEVDSNRGGDIIKSEKLTCDQNESVDKEVEHKCNAMNTGDLKFNNEQKFTTTNMLDCKIESNEIGAIKIEKSFCAEARTVFKDENIVEVEDKKILFDEEIDIKTDELDFNSFENGMAQLNGKLECSVLANKTHLLNHKIPSEVTTHKCNFCAYHTIRKSNLKRHLLKHKNPSKVTMHKCDSCAYQTIKKSNLKGHLLKHKNPSEATMYKCGSCSFQTVYKGALKSHLLRHRDISEVTMYKCDSCTYQTIYKGVLKLHLLKHKDISEVTVYKCDSCGYQTKYEPQLKRHLLKHKNPPKLAKYKCSSCSYLTKYKSELNRHLPKHKNPPKLTMYKCDSCRYQTKLKFELKRHSMKHKYPSKSTMYKCDSCTYQTIKKCYLKSHLLKHKDPSEVTMHKCDSCAFQTIHKGNLKTHSLKHKDLAEVTMYKCDSCLYQTKYKPDLKRHLLKHKKPSKLTTYKCDLCVYQAKYKSKLERHSLKHEYPSKLTMYKCDS